MAETIEWTSSTGGHYVAKPGADGKYAISLNGKVESWGFDQDSVERIRALSLDHEKGE